MQKELYRDEFEQMLQDAASRFRMQPAPRVWHSLYNDLHPGKKWPSGSSWLLIIFSFLLFSQTESQKSAQTGISTAQNRHRLLVKTGISLAASDMAKDHLQPAVQSAKKISSTEANTQTSFLKEAIVTKPEIRADEKTGEIPEHQDEKTGNAVTIESKSIQITMMPAARQHDGRPTHEASPVFPDNVSDSRFEYQLYATPSVGFREFRRRNEDGSLQEDPANTPGLASFNMEAGGNIIYRYNPYMRFKAGLQLNYSSTRFAEGAGSETTASFTADPANPYPASLQDPGSNGLHKENYQLSLPLGADLMLAGSDNIQWFAGATVQPTLLLPGNNKLSDPGSANYMINDGAAIRNWNVNGGIETFVSFKTGSGITLNAGPQFRYQLLSTYKDAVLYNERLYTIGLKLGISSRF